ncbi:MAG: hypothetical protein ACOXZW_01280 [Bacilli bacterium]|jgi:hypothetical protein|nr:hypothetical protein [Bacilli bacterium]
MRLKVKNIVILLIVVIVVTIISLFGVKILSPKEPGVEQPQVIDRIEGYDYLLAENKSALYKELFIKLKDTLEHKPINEEAYAKLIAQLFVVDFYTLNNKITKNDIGGVDFIHSEHQDNFILHARDTIYKYVKSNIYGDRKQKLPVVKTIEVSDIKQASFKYLEKEDPDAYYINLNWTYNQDLGYDTKAEIIIVHNQNKLFIVAMESLE